MNEITKTGHKEKCNTCKNRHKQYFCAACEVFYEENYKGKSQFNQYEKQEVYKMKFYTGAENSTGVCYDNRSDFINYINSLIDEAEANNQKVFEITIEQAEQEDKEND